MKYVSQLFQPLMTIPKNVKVKNAEITSKSQKLFIENGLIRSSGSGFYSFLPLAMRALNKLEALVHRSMRNAGAQQICMPTLTAAKLWKKSGRLDEMNEELFHVRDRHNVEYLLSPTHEEAITDLLSSVTQLSYKQLPLKLYQMTWKFRDEMRPKHGVVRAREFLMKDAYSFDVDADSATLAYHTMERCYAELFHALGVPYTKVEADNGAMGGTLSHEYHYEAGIGEDQLVTCQRCGESRSAPATTTQHACSKCGNNDGKTFSSKNSIEVAHTFILGERYSSCLNASYTTSGGALSPLAMGCYGVGLSRLLAAAVEARSPADRIVWPRPLAPYTVCIVGPKTGSKEEKAEPLVEKLYRDVCLSLPHLDGDVLVDDRSHLTIGKRTLEAVRTGYTYIVVVGKKALEPTGVQFEVQVTETGQTHVVTLTGLLQILAEAAPGSIRRDVAV